MTATIKPRRNPGRRSKDGVLSYPELKADMRPCSGRCSRGEARVLTPHDVWRHSPKQVLAECHDCRAQTRWTG